jgi:hypothetical protein
MRKYRDRIKTIRTVKASELVVNAENWRLHPADQRNELQAVLTEIGNVDVLKAVERPDGTLLLVDGHLRKDLHGDSDVRVAVLDLDEAETRKVLESYDRLAAAAKTDQEKLDALIQSIAASDSAPPPPAEETSVQAVIDAITTEEPVTARDERQATVAAEAVASHMRRLAQVAPDKLEDAQCVVVPTNGPCALLVIADPDLADIVAELRQRHEAGDTHPLDRLFDCIWTPGNA